MTKRNSSLFRNAAARRRSSERRRARHRELQQMRAQRNLRMECLEARRLLAGAPELAEIEAGGRPIADGDVRDETFQDLVFRFDADDTIKESTIEGGFELNGAGDDQEVGTGDDVTVEPEYAGFLGDSTNEVLLRFAETVPDGAYGIQIGGSVTSESGDSFNEGNTYNLEFTMDQGIEAITVTPQPMVLDPDTGELTQKTDEVRVDFNSHPVNPAVAGDPDIYQLTDEVTGDVLVPDQVNYVAESNQATLVFPNDLSGNTLHLQIGTPDPQPPTSSDDPLFQEAGFHSYESPVQYDADGNPVSTPIRDNETTVSRITVNEDVLIRDVGVELDMAHEWSPDLRVFLVGPDGTEVELVRDAGTEVLGGQ
ncbi:MAG: hypothetical protein ACQESR_18550, partial [Planctomycetota bacterium]